MRLRALALRLHVLSSANLSYHLRTHFCSTSLSVSSAIFLDRLFPKIRPADLMPLGESIAHCIRCTCSSYVEHWASKRLAACSTGIAEASLSLPSSDFIALL